MADRTTSRVAVEFIKRKLYYTKNRMAINKINSLLESVANLDGFMGEVTTSISNILEAFAGGKKVEVVHLNELLLLIEIHNLRIVQ